MECRTLFSPVRIGGLELKNRLVMAPIVSQIAGLDRQVTERTIDFYVARAAGGCGLIIVEGSHVRSDGRVIFRGLGIDDDRHIPGLTKLALAVHKAGSKVVIQLFHAGRFTSVAETGMRQIAPSAIASPLFGEVPRALPVEEIPALVEAWVEAARRAREAGFDGVELHGAHSYLLAGWLSPFSNHRTDEYGGDLSGRTRLAREIINGIRKSVGDDFVIIYRMNGVEFVEGGMTHEEAKDAAPMIVAAGVDALHVTCGPFESERSVAVAPIGTKQGWLADYVAGIKNRVNVPVIAVNRIADPRVAERILATGKADLVAMGRALLCDPDFPNKAERGAFNEIRRCSGCTQCGESLISSPSSPIYCMNNASLCRERERMPVPTKNPKRVMVIGGGPAGLEAARVAAIRGHKIDVYEANARLGGQLILAAAAPGRGELGLVIRYLGSELQRLGAEVHLKTKATLDLVESEKPDAIIVATGARPYIPPIPGAIAGNVVTAEAVLSGQAEVGDRVMVLGGGRIGLAVATLLVRRRKRLAVIDVMESALGQLVPQECHVPDLADALMAGQVDMFSCTSVREIRNGAALLDQEGKKELWGRYMFPLAMQRNGFNRYQDFDGEELSGFDSIVLALQRVSNCELGDQLRDMVPEVHVIGDAVKPREVRDAIDEGNRVGLSI